MGDLVSAYENQQNITPQSNGIDALRYLIESHRIKQSELPEVGSQGVVSEVLSGALNTKLGQPSKINGFKNCLSQSSFLSISFSSASSHTEFQCASITAF